MSGGGTLPYTACQEFTGVYAKRFEDIFLVILAWNLLFHSSKALGRGTS